MAQTTSREKLAKLLKQERESRKLTVLKVSKQLKVPSSTIKALENPEDTTIPDVVARGLFKSYASQLDILTPEFKLILRSVEPNVEFKVKTKQTFNRARFFVLSKAMLISVVAISLSVIFGYAVLQARNLLVAPNLSLETPTTDLIVEDANLLISGTSNPDSSVAINGEPLPLNDTGKFSTNVYLQEGQNIIIVSAVNSFAREQVITRTIYYQPAN